MKYIAAYLLAQAGGNSSPSQSQVKNILEGVGVQVDDSALSSLFGKLDGKDIAELIKEGSSKLAVVGGGSAPAAAGNGAAATEKKEEKKEEEEEVEMAGGFDDLFG